jgi:hypothetical protein
MSRSGLLGAALAAALTVAACSPSEDDDHGLAGVIAEAICEQYYECDCEVHDPEPHADRAACLAEWRMNMDHTLSELDLGGLTYAPDCVDGYLESLEDRGCKTREETPGSECSGPCSFYHGTVSHGQACEGSPFASNCAPGLVCWIGHVCLEPCDWNEGPGLGEPCDIYACGPSGLYCDVSVPGAEVCREQKQNGSACEVPSECLSYNCDNGACTTSGPAICL